MSDDDARSSLNDNAVGVSASMSAVARVLVID